MKARKMMGLLLTVILAIGLLPIATGAVSESGMMVAAPYM